MYGPFILEGDISLKPHSSANRISRVYLSVMLIFAIIIVALSYENSAASSGECALGFLNLPLGAYSASMGQGDFAGVIGPEAIFRNPALLGSSTAGFFSHQELLLDTRSEAAVFALQMSDKYTLGIGVVAFDPGTIQGYTADNTKNGNVPAGDRLIRLAIASRSMLSYGLSLSYYYERLDEEVANGFGLGGGVTLENSLGRFALTADNIGPRFKTGNSSASLPQRYSLSAWLPIRSNTFGLSGDLSYDLDLGILLAAGAEYKPLNFFSLRAGTNSQAPFAAGMRIAYRQLAFDYSYIPSRLFGDRHIFSMSVSK